MMDKESILDALDDFKDEYGDSFSSAYPEAAEVIEKALDLYYEKVKEERGGRENMSDLIKETIQYKKITSRVYDDGEPFCRQEVTNRKKSCRKDKKENVIW